MTFDEPEPAPETQEEQRRRREEEELARVIELSKQDKGGRGGAPAAAAGQGSSSAGGSSQGHGHFAAAALPVAAAAPLQPAANSYAPGYAAPAAAANYNSHPPAQEAEQPPLDINTTTRVRALYTFTSSEVGELNFERGDVIKVLDRGFKQWWRGASNGKIGIFPVTYVEALPEPTPRELQEEAQEEARVFASLGLVDKLLETLKNIDPARGDRIEDNAEVNEMYQASVSLQTQINALIKKYSDQKAELEHMNSNFLRAMRQYDELKGGPPQRELFLSVRLTPEYAYPQGPQSYTPQQQHSGDQYQQSQPPQQQYNQASGDQYAQQPPQQQQQQYPQAHQVATQPSAHNYETYGQQYPTDSPAAIQQGPPQFPQPHAGSTAPGQPGQPGMYYQNQASTSSLQRAPSGAPSFPPASPPNRQGSAPGQAGVGAGQEAADNQAAWDAYYRAQGGHPAPGPAPPGVAPQAGQPAAYAPQQHGGYPGVDAAAQGVSRMSVGQ